LKEAANKALEKALGKINAPSANEISGFELALQNAKKRKTKK